MTPEELARMQAGLDPRAYYSDADLLRRAQAGEIPAEALQGRGATPIKPRGSQSDQAKQFARETLGKVQGGLSSASAFLGGIPTGRLGLGLGAIPALGTAYSELQADRPLGAAGGLLGGAAGGLSGAAVARFLPTTGKFGLIGKAAQAVLPAIGASFGAPAFASEAERIKARATNEPIRGKEAELSSQLATQRALNELGQTQLRTSLGTYTSALTDLNKANIEANLYAMQKEIPLIEQIERGRLARAQTMLNAQNNAYLQQMTLGAQSNLMLDAQRERGATMRQVLASNPYMVALQSPNVSIS
jgi:hypothetical protein